MIKVGSDFSGVGAFDQALRRLKINYKTVYSCDMDKYARQTYIENYGEPEYYPENVYDREIPKEALDIYMTSPPCQSFSLAGKRKGEDSVNGVLFYNSHEFIMKNSPRYFIFENVKGLLSDANGRTFQIWLDMLGGKSVNGNPVLFPREDAAPYHIYHKVLNAKHFGVPQNRERVFIIGIRDDGDNSFSFPKPFHLTKRLKDVLETDVDEKYYLSDTQVNSVKNSKHEHSSRVYEINDCSPTVMAKSGGGHEPYINEVIQLNKSKESGGVQPYKQNRIYDANGISPVLDTECGRPYIKTGTELKLIGLLSNEKYNDFSRRIYSSETIGRTLMGSGGNCNDKTGQYLIENRIRRLTPRECFRLMDFPDTFTWHVSDTQAYKQAGNSIVVNVLYEIINKLVK